MISHVPLQTRAQLIIVTDNCSTALPLPLDYIFYWHRKDGNCHNNIKVIKYIAPVAASSESVLLCNLALESRALLNAFYSQIHCTRDVGSGEGGKGVHAPPPRFCQIR